jgi:hypothetical protein
MKNYQTTNNEINQKTEESKIFWILPVTIEERHLVTIQQCLDLIKNQIRILNFQETPSMDIISQSLNIMKKIFFKILPRSKSKSNILTKHSILKLLKFILHVLEYTWIVVILRNLLIKKASQKNKRLTPISVDEQEL